MKMKALIDPRDNEFFIKSWESFLGTWQPIVEKYDNSARICELKADDAVFEVAEPLFWIDFPEGLDTKKNWYNIVENTFNPIQNTPPPI